MLNPDPLHIVISRARTPVPVYLHVNKSAYLFGNYLCFYLIVNKDDKHAVIGRGTVGGATITWPHMPQHCLFLIKITSETEYILKNSAYKRLYIIFTEYTKQKPTFST